MNERARKILNEARATIERIDDQQREWNAENAAHDLYEPLVREPPRSTQRSTPVTQQTNDFSGWERWLQGHLDVAAYEIGACVAEVETRLTKRIAELEADIGQLRAERAVERAAVIALPGWRRRDAA
jgi:hypothetical protein